jgi:iron complex outermembrane receptor protein
MKIYLLIFIALIQFPARLRAEEQKSITGKVIDAQTKEPLPGAVVSIPDLKKSVPTNVQGVFEIGELPVQGKYIIQVSYIGYKTLNITLDLGKSESLNFALVPSFIESSEVIVTGVSKATEMKKSPIPIVAINKNFIDQHAASGNVIDLIAGVPGVSAVTTGPNVSKPYIHGLGYNRVVTLQDGIRQEGQQWGDEHGIEVDQNSIDRIEIIKGPASLSYGSDAIGGVINLISPAPVAEGKIAGLVQGTYGTNQSLFNGSFRLQGNQKGLIWGTILSGKIAKNYENAHDGRVYNTGYQEKDARAMIGMNKTWGYSYLNASLFDDLQDIPDGSRDSASRKFTKQITDSDTFRPIVSNHELNTYAIPVLHQHVQLFRIYNNSLFNLGSGNLIVNLGFQYSHRREFTHPQNSEIPGLNLELTTYTYDFKYNFEWPKDYEMSLGLNGMYQTNRLGYSTDFPIPAYHQFDIGPFIILKRSFGKLDISGGIRYDSRSFLGKSAYIDTLVPYYPSLYTGSNPEGSPNLLLQFPSLKKNFGGASGSLGATYNFDAQFLIKANIARGFRAPSISELSANGPDPGSQIYHVGNRSFKPEFSTQEDIGAFLTYSHFSGSVELFTNTLENYIFQEQILNTDGTPQRVNPDGSNNPHGTYSKFTYVQSKARIQGGEISLDLHLIHWLHFENSLSITQGQNLGTGATVPDSLKYLPFIPPFHTHSEIRGNFKKGFSILQNLYVSLSLDHFNAQNQFFSAYGTETRTPGYNLINAGMGADLTNSKGKVFLKVFVEGKNLAGTVYQSNMSRLKYFDNPVVPKGIAPGIFNIGRNIDFKLVMPFELSSPPKNI